MDGFGLKVEETSFLPLFRTACGIVWLVLLCHCAVAVCLFLCDSVGEGEAAAVLIGVFVKGVGNR